VAFVESVPASTAADRADLVDRANLLELGELEDGFGHAGEFETAIGLALDGTVRPECVPPPARPLDPGAPGGSAIVFHRAPDPRRDSRHGVIGDAGSARAEVGAAVLEMATTALVEHCLELLGRTLASRSSEDGHQ
jgi:creatinine amidohydrolase/Fe(II)-dependent formamide hydrolase-like protein